MGLPLVAIVGRPNVGKSTLFNRIVGGRRAIVHDEPGVTRDRLVERAEWDGKAFRLADTGGFEAETESRFAERIRDQSFRAVEDADLVVFVVDGHAGLSPADEEAARFLARAGRPVILAANKVDSARREEGLPEYWGLGLGEPVPVSAEHGRGVGDLLDRIVAAVGTEDTEEESGGLRMALIGRPNAGKSSLLNRLTGEDRVLVDETPGTTRDAIDTRLVVDGEPVVLVDTAGVRRRSRIAESLEQSTVRSAIRAADRSDVVVLVVDATDRVTDQDARLARLVQDRGRGLVLAVNKWDLVPRAERHPGRWIEDVRRRYPHFGWVPAVCLSALEGTGTDQVFPVARRAEAAFSSRIPTAILNELAQSFVEPPVVKGKRARLYYAACVATRPPTIALVVNDRERVPEGWLRYVENRLREAFPLEGTPLRLRVRTRKRPPRKRNR